MTPIERFQKRCSSALLIAFLCFAAFAFTVWIPNALVEASPPPQQEEGYRTIRTAPVFIWEDEAGADSVDVSTPSAVALRAPKPTNGNPTVAVDVEFSGAANDNVVITVILWHLAVDDSDVQTFTRMGIQRATATATTDRHGAAGDFVARTLYFDSSSATHYEVRHAAPSAGTCDGTVWSYGVLAE